MNARTFFLVAIVLISLSARADDLAKLGYETTYFYLTPSRASFDRLQSGANQLAGTLEKKDNVALIVAVVIATAADKYHWEITGKGRISDLAREVAKGQSPTAKYVHDDARVDVGKLDIWWAEFFATGETRYPGKILHYAKYPQPGEHAADFMMPAMAAGRADVTCDFIAYKPDGSVYGKQSSAVVWKRGYPARSGIQLSEGYMGIRIEKNDPAGTYKVVAKVHDRVKKVDLILTTTFRVPR